MSQVTSLEAECLVVLREGDEPWSTGQICDELAVLAPITEERRVRHGRPLNPRMIRGTNREAFEECPSCECTETVVVSRPFMATRVRAALKRLKKRGLVIEIEAPLPNNHGGNLWLRTDRKDAYYAKMFS